MHVCTPGRRARARRRRRYAEGAAHTCEARPSRHGAVIAVDLVSIGIALLVFALLLASIEAIDRI